MTPVYPTTAGLSLAALRRNASTSRCQQADLGEMPAADRCASGCSSRPSPTASSCCTIRRPPWSLASCPTREHPAWRRIKFDELLAQQLSLRRAHEARRAKTARRCRRKPR
jgi:ATP-dependent DNA helicase RecG